MAPENPGPGIASWDAADVLGVGDTGPSFMALVWGGRWELQELNGLAGCLPRPPL